MRLSSGAVVIAAACALGLAPAPPVRFEADVAMVRIDVVVLDRDGQPVRGLTAADFEVVENGRPHDIVSFEPIEVRSPSRPPEGAGAPSAPRPPAPEENRSFLVYIDDIHLGPQSAERVRARLVPFLQREVRGGDWVTLVAPLSGLRWTARTELERREMGTVLARLNGTFLREPFRQARTDRDVISEYEAVGTVDSEGRRPVAARGPDSTYSGNLSHIVAEKRLTAERRIRVTLEALEAAVRSLAGFRGRKALIFYSEGFARSVNMPDDYDRVIEEARRAHVAIYFVHAGGLESGLAGASVGDYEDRLRPGPLVLMDTAAGGTAYLAAATGGRSSISNDVASLLREAAVESSAYYLIGFQPTPGPDGERKIQVRARRDGLTVRATNRYRVGVPPGAARPRPAAADALFAVGDATGVSFRVATLALENGPAGERKTTLVLEFDPPAGEHDHARERIVNLIVDLRAAAGGAPVRDDVELAVSSALGRPAVATRELRLAPGVWQARVVVRDARTDAVGSALHTFEVPAPAGLRLSSPILTDVLDTTGRPKPVLKLARRYSTAGALYLQYRVFGAANDPSAGRPHVKAAWTIRGAAGVVREDPPSAIEPAADGTLIRLVGIGLAGLAPGDYTLALRVSDEVAGTTAERNESFTVVAES